MKFLKDTIELAKDLSKDTKWTKDILTGTRGMSASDKSYIDHNGKRKAGEFLVKALWKLYGNKSK
ncbi:hypothetical protein HPS57_10265 [Prevotella sp. PINT]|jgi:hypothetical protein|uniref:hypothetical protein n=1 Tax=Palleniella intestinalis TaxID=2736291 RepID=UPI001556BC7D|nr:hypothetical protein [Palleniella intestinalis]NPD82351.1 hypothetical protein [Palleniella intestinalis]